MALVDGKVAIITGAMSGIGRATALLFAREGANVMLADRNERDGAEAAVVASGASPRCVFQRADVFSEEEIAALLAQTSNEFGRLDILFNKAGIAGAVDHLEFVLTDKWDKSQAILLGSVFLGTKHTVVPMRAAGGGSIISAASGAAIHGFSGLHAYCAAKAASLSRSTAIDLARDFIRVNVIASGVISTAIVWSTLGVDQATAEARIGQPDDIAQAALFLASNMSTFVTGRTLVVDGGRTTGAMSGPAPASILLPALASRARRAKARRDPNVRREGALTTRARSGDRPELGDRPPASDRWTRNVRRRRDARRASAKREVSIQQPGSSGASNA